ncbi:hypothetical protein [Burkholderia orbicola]|uniref:hypothetical protein n=1 Tax=Burkholderia cepacia complex TaxID=87882 RepID=UPI0020B126CD|nr:hypothetical protein [Burkholderia cenocepacia]
MNHEHRMRVECPHGPVVTKKLHSVVARMQQYGPLEAICTQAIQECTYDNQAYFVSLASGRKQQIEDAL